MCGIVGYCGKHNSVPVLLEGLHRLEYRGYDSAGVAVLTNGAICVIKAPGKIKALDTLVEKRHIPAAPVGIAHTRWATHGAPTKANAHPHTDCAKKYALVHNGIIENYVSLKKALARRGHRFSSQTDTEIIVHLIEELRRNAPDLKRAFLQALHRLEGSFALALVSQEEPQRIFFARRGSPLIVGVGDGENFIASDVPAILGRTNKVIYVNDDQAGDITKERVTIFDAQGRTQKTTVETVTWDLASAQKSGYPHFMLKEINEQPQVVKNLASHGLKLDAATLAVMRHADKICIVACGTAYHAGMVGKYIIEQMAKVPVTVDVSSEFRYRHTVLDKKTLLIAISQSGETADTLAAVREARRKKIKVISICNVVGSSLTRESDAVLYTLAGPEIGVASTKAYTAQLMVLYQLCLYLAQAKKALSRPRLRQYSATLAHIGVKQHTILKNCTRTIAHIAKYHHTFGSFLFLGRTINYPSALEGALKLKEISYIPAEGYPAGEMKHGPIALIDEYRAVVCIAPDSAIYEKMVSNIQEIEARKGKIVIIASEGNDEIRRYSKDVIFIPKIDELFSPLLVALPLQLFAYYVAAQRGCNIDQPRNLAKSVTVE